MPVWGRWWARSNATTFPRVDRSKFPVMVVEYPANVRYCCRTRTSWPLIPGHSTRSPRCWPLWLVEAETVAPPLLGRLDAAIAVLPRPITPTSAAAPAQRARRRSTFDINVPSLSHAYGVSCRARAERVALRLGLQAIRPRSRSSVGFPVPPPPGDAEFGWAYIRAATVHDRADLCRATLEKWVMSTRRRRSQSSCKAGRFS